MNLYDGAYSAKLLKKGTVYDTDAGQKVTGDGRRYGVFCDGLIVTSLKTTAPNLGTPMPEIYSNGIYAAKMVERFAECAAQLQEDKRMNIPQSETEKLLNTLKSIVGEWGSIPLAENSKECLPQLDDLINEWWLRLENIVAELEKSIKGG